MTEIAYGNYHTCDKCGSSELVNGIGWDCVCNLLIYYGNCKNCLLATTHCKCVKKTNEILWSDDEEPPVFGLASSYRLQTKEEKFSVDKGF